MTAQLIANSQHAAGTDRYPGTVHSIYSKPGSPLPQRTHRIDTLRNIDPMEFIASRKTTFLHYTSYYSFVKKGGVRGTERNRIELRHRTKLCELSSRKRGELKDKACPLIPSGNSTSSKQHRRRLPAAWHHTTCN